MQFADILRKVKSMDIPEGVVAIYLYGSSVNGKMREESDIDIAFLPSFKTTLDERLISENDKKKIDFYQRKDKIPDFFRKNCAFFKLWSFS